MKGWIRSAAGAVVACAGAAALAGIDVESAPNLKVKSSLAPGEAEHFRFRAEAGGALTLSAKASPKSNLDFDLVLLDGADAPVPVPAEVILNAGGKVSWKKFVVPATDDYRLQVSGTGSGDYSLSLKVAPAKKFAGGLEFVGVPTLDFPIAAPAGSTIKAVVKATRGSLATPRFQSLDGPNAFTQDLSAEGTLTSTSHAVALAPLADGGDYVFHLANAGAPGTFTVTVLIKAPKSKPVKLDLRGVVLGKPGGGETFLARPVDQTGGVVLVDDLSSDLDRAQVDVPAGALSSTMTISVGSAAVPPIMFPDDQAAGPAVDLRPSGTQFLMPVTVTLPLDFTQIPLGTDPNDIQVQVVEDNGETFVIDPVSVDAMAGTLTVQTTGFSICIPIVGSGPPNLGIDSRGQVKPGGEEFWLLTCLGELSPEGVAQDSRTRSFGTGFGTVSFFADGTLDFASLDHEFSWLNLPGTGGPPIQSGLTESNAPSSGTLDWAYDASGRRILLSGSPEAQPEFRISRDGRFIAGRHENLDEPYAEAIFGVRKNAVPLTIASLQGTWNAVFLEMLAGQTGPTGAAEPQLDRGTATITFDGNGGARLVITQRETEFNASNGSFAQPIFTVTVNGASYSIDGDGTVLVDIPPLSQGDSGTTLRLFPGQGLDVMFGGHDQVLGNGAFGLVLVRQGSGQSRSDLVGDYHGASFAVEPRSYTPPGAPSLFIADFEVLAEGTSASFTGGTTASLTFDSHAVSREPGQPGGVRVENSVEPVSLGVNLASTGKLALSAPGGGGVGAVTDDGNFMVLTSDTGSPNADYSLIFLFLSPPDSTP